MRILMLCIRLLVEEQALMVVDHKGQIRYATNQLASLLGHPVSGLLGMPLTTVIPPPYAQLHAEWLKMKVRARYLSCNFLFAVSTFAVFWLSGGGHDYACFDVLTWMKFSS